MTLLGATVLSIIEIAHTRGRESLDMGICGRTLRYVFGKTANTLQADAPIDTRLLGLVSAWVLKAAQYPAITAAVSETRRRMSEGVGQRSTKEM
ncbi:MULTISPECIES: hypothetical protein [Acidovorax]|uniref:hypothetical protein n=1 Tax=Acidovorax TaxID=12916 RepID=UPI00023785FB|nr:hypothetical protein [Acidovorax radicis]